jgi:predicted transcriptional regulator
MVKRTFVLDDQSAAYLDRTADRLGMPKSWVVREALRAYGEQLGRLTDEERDEALAAFDRAIANVPARPRAEVDAELEQIAAARRKGGRKRA